MSKPQSLVRVQGPRFALDLGELAEEPQGLLGHRTLGIGMQLEELALRMGCAARLHHALREAGLVAAEVIAHQLAAPWLVVLLQERTSVFARAAGREVIDDGLEVFKCARAVRPEVGAVRLLLARRHHRHGCLVGMQHAVAQHLVLECVHQGLQLHAAGSDPLGQCRARQRHACPRKDAFLPVQRQVVGVLGHQHLSQKAPGGCQS